ncbi:unnamed protein product, partial [Symbiodinium sp. KB8]
RPLYTAAPPLPFPPHAFASPSPRRLLSAVVRQGRQSSEGASRVGELASTIKSDVTRLNDTLCRLEDAAEKQREAARASASGASLWGSSGTDASGAAASSKAEADHGAAVVGNLKHSLLSATAGLQTLLSSHTATLHSVAERRERIGIRSSALAAASPAQGGARVPAGPSPRAGAAASGRQGSRGGAAAAAAGAYPAATRAGRLGAAAAGQGSDRAPLLGASAPRLGDDGEVDVASEFGAIDVQAMDPAAGELAQARARSKDMQEIERATAEVADMFKRLSSILAEQSEQIQGVEASLDGSLDALESGESHLRRANDRAGSNVLLGLQVAAVLLVALVAFLLFAA